MIRFTFGVALIVSAFILGVKFGEVVFSPPSPYEACIARLTPAYPGEWETIEYVCKEWK